MRRRINVPPVPADRPRPQRFRRGKGPRYIPDVVERARVLIVGTTWPIRAIAAQVGIATMTVNRWKTARGWTRPMDASISTGKVGTARAGLTRRSREALRTLEAIAVREILRLRDGRDGSHERLEQAVSLLLRTRAALRPTCRKAA